MNGRLRIAALALLLLFPLLASVGPAAAADKPVVTLSTSQAGTGDSVTVSGSGWRARTLLMLLVCGQATPARGVVGGTNSCANADGRAVTTDADGRFSRRLPVAEPPVPCPCVVHVATATGAKAAADAVFQVAGHPVEPLPEESAGGKLSILTDTRLDGSSGLLTWFGAPPTRTLVFTVGNLGTTTVKDPLFEVGTAHGVFAPQWDERQWRGTIAPGKKARVELPVELSAGAHGDYTVSLKYGGKVLAEQPWGVGRPWGVTLFWILLCVVVPAALFRIGMAVVDRLRPQTRQRRRTPRRHTEETPDPAPTTSTTLPWFTPDTGPGTAGRLSAPHDDHPTSPRLPAGRDPSE
ncbi:neocarzinostatin apoprotein domain-containing protein [Streptomyces sp. NPDC049687]|uniref:neocarzinostatin apoprotein domain-containing protein n=1 Tax=Streptomyces sp. NPDC049687 TaxID=3365596 RepID=UPI0037879B69